MKLQQVIENALLKTTWVPGEYVTPIARIIENEIVRQFVQRVVEVALINQDRCPKCGEYQDAPNATETVADHNTRYTEYN